jgi:hypothetical protein
MKGDTHPASHMESKAPRKRPGRRATHLEVVYTAVESERAEDRQKALERAFGILFDAVMKMRRNSGGRCTSPDS